MNASQTWLPINDAARAAGISAKALRRRIERGTVTSELRDDGRRHVHVESIINPVPAPPRGERGTPDDLATGQLLLRLEQLAAENGRLRALTAIAESTEQRLTGELHEQRAQVITATARAAELEQLEAELATAGPMRAWRLARRLRSRHGSLS